jgi:NAD(P)-dependent dehydrogenase (short-subunit alcohol dehydrogenase family)
MSTVPPVLPVPDAPDLSALVVGASGGIGAALCDALAPVRLTRLSRRHDGLEITDAASVAAAAARLTGPFDLIIDATGALEIDGHRPEKALAEIDADALARQFAVNAIGPALLMKHLLPMLARDRRAVFASLSARVGSIGDNRLGGWYGYRAAKAALNQLVHTAAIEMTRRNRQSIVVALHPGTVATPMTARHARPGQAVPAAEAAHNVLTVIAGLTPDDTGGFFDWKGAAIPW